MSYAPTLIFVAGYAGSGKTTAAAIMARLLKSHNVKLAAFADAVKEETARVYKYPLRLAYSQEGKKSIVQTEEGEKTVRDILIEYSLEAKKQRGEDVWAKTVADKIATTGLTDPWILHDWRFLAEAETLKRNLCPQRMITVRIVRSGVVPLDSPSEHELDGLMMTHTIENDGTVSELEHQLAAMLRNYFDLSL